MEKNYNKNLKKIETDCEQKIAKTQIQLKKI